MTFTAKKLRECAERALRSMQRRYPGYVARRRMSEREAARQIGMMTAIIERLREDEERETLV